MSKWFEGSGEIQCSLEQVEDGFRDVGEAFVGLVRLMPGLSKVALVEQGPGFVTIKTNEGLMKRTNISKRVDADRVVVEFDEEYQAGKRITVWTHFMDEFTSSAAGIRHRIVASDVKAPGILGFFYRIFGRSSMRKAFVASYKTYFEQTKAPDSPGD